MKILLDSTAYNNDNDLFYWNFKDLKYMFKEIDQKINNPILIIASMGLWNGRQTGYKIVDHLQDIFSTFSTDNFTVYIENKNLKIKYSHHDGTNYLTIRELKETNYNSLLDDLYINKKISNKKLNYHTKNLYKEFKEYFGA